MQYVRDNERPENLERIVDRSTSPSLLIKTGHVEAISSLLDALSAGGWNVLATEDEEFYKVLATEGGFDILLNHTPENKVSGYYRVQTQRREIALENPADATQSVFQLDKAFIEIANPNMAFVGPIETFDAFRNTVLSSVYLPGNKIARSQPEANTGLVILDPSTGEEYQDTEIPVIKVTDRNETEGYAIKKADLKNEVLLIGMLRQALAGYYKKDVNHPRKIICVQTQPQMPVFNWLDDIGHRVTTLTPDKLKKADKLLSKKTKSRESFYQILPRDTDVIIGELSNEYLRFIENLKSSNLLDFQACAIGSYKTSSDKLLSLLFLLSSGNAFIRPEQKGLHMLRILLRNLNRKKRLPFRSFYEKWENEKIASVCKNAEKHIYAGEIRGHEVKIGEALVSLFGAISAARTSLPIANLIYCINHLRDARPEIMRLLELRVRNNYEALERGIDLGDIKRHLATSFSKDPFRVLVQNLRRGVVVTKYPSHYVLYNKVRLLDEAERYTKVYDFFTRLNRRYSTTSQETSHPVELSELVWSKKLDKDMHLLVERQEIKDETLLDFLHSQKDADVISKCYEAAVIQAARTSAQGPLSAAQNVDDLASFWSSRFDVRIKEPFYEGFSKLFNLQISDSDFSALYSALDVVWNHLSQQKFISGFYSDRWPGNLGRRENGDLYNFGFRLCYCLPSIIEQVTVFQHTDYLTANSVDDKIKQVASFVKTFFEEFDNSTGEFNKIVGQYESNPKQFILDEIRRDIDRWKEYKLMPRTTKDLIEDPINMSFASKDSLTRIFLYPNQETLAQMLEISESLLDNSSDMIFSQLYGYAVSGKKAYDQIKPMIATARSVEVLQSRVCRQFKKDPKLCSRLKSIFSALPANANAKIVEAELIDELYEKPTRYFDLLKGFSQNLSRRQTMHEFENGDFEKALNEKYIPAHFVAMMERGLIAGGAVLKSMSDIKSYDHPLDPEQVPQYSRSPELVKMCLQNSIKAAEVTRHMFGEKNPELAKAADAICNFGKSIYNHISSLEQQPHI